MLAAKADYFDIDDRNIALQLSNDKRKGRRLVARLAKSYAKRVIVALTSISTMAFMSNPAFSQGRKEDMVRYEGKLYDAACLYSLSQRPNSATMTDEEYFDEMELYCSWTGVENPSFEPGEGANTIGSVSCASLNCVRVYGRNFR